MTTKTDIEQERRDFEAWWEVRKPAASIKDDAFSAYQAGRASVQEQPTDHAEFELVQYGVSVASATGKREDAWREIQHYAAVYSQDDPVEIYEVIRRRIEGEANANS